MGGSYFRLVLVFALAISVAGPSFSGLPDAVENSQQVVETVKHLAPITPIGPYLLRAGITVAGASAETVALACAVAALTVGASILFYAPATASPALSELPKDGHYKMTPEVQRYCAMTAEKMRAAEGKKNNLGMAGDLTFEEKYFWVNGDKLPVYQHRDDPQATKAEHARKIIGPEEEEHGELKEREWAGIPTWDARTGLWNFKVKHPFPITLILSAADAPADPTSKKIVLTPTVSVQYEIMEEVDFYPYILDRNIRPGRGWVMVSQTEIRRPDAIVYDQIWVRFHSVHGVRPGIVGSLKERIYPSRQEMQDLHDLYVWTDTVDYEERLKELDSKGSLSNDEEASEQLYFESVVEQILGNGEASEARKVLDARHNIDKIKALIIKWYYSDHRKG